MDSEDRADEDSLESSHNGEVAAGASGWRKPRVLVAIVAAIIALLGVLTNLGSWLDPRGSVEGSTTATVLLKADGNVYIIEDSGDVHARLAGVDRSMISRYETGRRSPRLDTLQRLAEVVDLEVVVSFRPASPRHAIEPSDPGTSKVVLPDSMSTSDGETGRQDGDAIFTMRADVTAYREG